MERALSSRRILGIILLQEYIYSSLAYILGYIADIHISFADIDISFEDIYRAPVLVQRERSVPCRRAVFFNTMIPKIESSYCRSIYSSLAYILGSICG